MEKWKKEIVDKFETKEMKEYVKFTIDFLEERLMSNTKCSFCRKKEDKILNLLLEILIIKNKMEKIKTWKYQISKKNILTFPYWVVMSLVK